MNSSRGSMTEVSSSPFFILSVNISLFVMVMAFLCHVTALVALLRREMRRKLLASLMINVCVISLVLATCGYTVTLTSNLKIETENDTKEVFLCNWTAFVSVFCSCAYSVTLCAMTFVSAIAAGRCLRAEAQAMSRKSTIVMIATLWIYPIFVSGPSFIVGNVFRLSASELICLLHWPSVESSHNAYNIFASVAIFFLPMVVCLQVQYRLSRIWKRARGIEDNLVRRRLLYRRKVNRMVIGLTFSFFLSHLPYHITNLMAMATGHYHLHPKAAFVLELVVQSNLLCPPLAYLFLNQRYRITLKHMIRGTTGLGQRGGSARRRDAGAARARQRTRPRQVRFSNRVGPSPRSTERRHAAETTSMSSTPKGTDSTSSEKATSTRNTENDTIPTQEAGPSQHNPQGYVIV